MIPSRLGAWLVLTAIALAAAPPALAQNFKETRSRSQYAHYIEIYDAKGFRIDPAAEDAKPYSPDQTCKKCHDYDAIAHGYHFNAADLIHYAAPQAALGKPHEPKKIDHGRPGEPWLLTEAKVGTQIPLSYRGWPGTLHPDALGLSRFDFAAKFGTHFPGGGVGERPPLKAEQAETGSASPSTSGAEDEAAPTADPRWASRGRLEIDCMICHSADRHYSHAKFIQAVQDENFAWAPTIALGLGKVEGVAKTLPPDYDPAKPPEGEASKLPKTKYKPEKFDAEGLVFFDVVRTPSNNACYMCHTTRPVGQDAQPKWVHDEDVHLRAGMRCADCHRNGIGHHTVRGFEGETHPTDQKVDTLSCRGCHYDEPEAAGPSDMGGRLGAPKPLHKGIPPIHFDTMSCTSCHSGPLPKDAAQLVQTAMAHRFGEAIQTRDDDDMPRIAQPVFIDIEQADGKEMMYPHRMVWPAYFGWMRGDEIKPILPDDMVAALRQRYTPFRPRLNFREEASGYRLTKEDREQALGVDAAKPDDELIAEQKLKLDELLAKRRKAAFDANLSRILAFMTLTAQEAAQAAAEGDDAANAQAADNAPRADAVPVYVSGGKVYRLKPDAALPELAELRRAEALAMEVVKNHRAAQPYAWPLAHDVRPARRSLGVTGCTECHSADAPMFYGKVAALGPALDDEPLTSVMHEMLGEDTDLLAKWEQSFEGRPLFKWVGFVAVGVVTLIIVLGVLMLLGGLAKAMSGRR